MSKSYNNIIPIFAPEKELRKLINKIQTNSQLPGEPKDPATSPLFQIYKAFASDTETAEIEKRYAEGIAWGEMKAVLFEFINQQISEARNHYWELLRQPGFIEAELRKGAEKARSISVPFLKEIKSAVGFGPLGG
jgi:tryptophanyl-tRNA synthetase